jgi:hypothetical protein
VSRPETRSASLQGNAIGNEMHIHIHSATEPVVYNGAIIILIRQALTLRQFGNERSKVLDMCMNIFELLNKRA